MKNLIITCVLLFNIVAIYAQTDDQLNHDRYWYYRHRLYWDFMQHSDGVNLLQGTDIPAGERGFLGAHNILKGGDGTIELGWYIASLATEYKLLSDNGQDTRKTEADLFGAIEAFNRLDYNAETYYKNALGNPGTAALNGFFVRDDIPNNAFLYSGPGSLVTGVTSRFPMSGVEFELSRALVAGIDPRAAGADQIWYLLLGFKLVKEYLPSTKTFIPGSGMPSKQFMDGETKFVKEIQNIVDRIFDWLLFHNWKVFNPVTGQDLPNIDGGDARPHSFGAAVVADQISPLHPHQDTYSLTTGLTVWQNLSTTGWVPQTPCVFQSTDNDKFLLLAALGNSWPPATIGSRSADDDYEYIPLLQQVLWGTTNPIMQSTYETLFNDAPCEAPYEYKDYSTGIVHYPTNEWSSRSRFVHPEARHDYPCAPNNPPDFEGEYNGLDYMLFHNLYYINDGYSSAYEQRYINDVNHNYPFAIGAGSSTINAFQSIYSGNINLSATADVTYHAGYYLHINSFSAYAGANFHAYVAPFTCASTLSEYRYQAMKDTSSALNQVVAQSYFHPDNSSDALIANAYVSERIIPFSNESKTFYNIFPNPNTDGHFNIKCEGGIMTGCKLIVYDVLGNIIIESSYVTNNLYEIDISDHPKGIYILKIEDSDKITMEKIIYQ